MSQRIRQRIVRALGLEDRLTATEQATRGLGDRLTAAEETVRGLDADARARAAERGERDASIAGRLQTLELRARVPVVMATAAQSSLREELLVSVVMPTHNRASILPLAVESVRAQTYGNWELLVVEDGGERSAARLVEGIGEPRIRVLEREHAGLCAARNAGLEAARGELIAYLDDDNRMDPGWLRTVAWAFERRPDADVLFGGYVIDDVARLNDAEGGGMPGLVLNEFSRDRLAEANPADMSAIAHRAGLAEARFDESLSNLGDWELLARLTAAKDPFVVPAIACYYGTEPRDRLSLDPPDPRELEAVRRAVAASPS